MGGVKRLKQFVFFVEIVMLHIELMGMEQITPCKHILCSYSHPRSLVGGHFYLLKVVMLHSKLKRMEHIAPCKHIFCPCTNLRWGERSKHIFCLKVVILHIILMQTNIMSLHTHSVPRAGVKMSTHFLTESSNNAYKMKGNRK